MLMVSRINKRISRFISILALAIITTFSIQSAVAQDFTFSSIKIEGNKRIETDTIINYTAIFTDEVLSASEVDAAIQRVRDSGLFKSVNVDVRGSTLVIKVQELPTINIVTFEGNSAIKDAALTNLVRSKPRQIFSQFTTREDADAIAKTYADQGRLTAVVTPRIIERSDNRVDLVYEISEGGVIEIERVSFVGNKAFHDNRLRRLIETKQAGYLRWLVSSDTFVQDRIEFDKQLLNNFYESNGFVDFEILDVRAELTKERDAFLLTFVLREGPQFKFGNVTISSEVPTIKDTNDFNEFVKIQSGEIFTESAIDDSISGFEVFATNRGYNFVRVEPRLTRNDANQTLDVDFVLAADSKVFVERIDIKGNSTTADHVIRRNFDFVEGDPFNSRKMRKSIERIRGSGFFANVNVNAREGSSPNQVVIDVEVTERATGTFSIGGNYNSSDGFSLVGKWAERNYLGRGQGYHFNLNWGEKATSFDIGFTEPSVLDRNVAFGLDLSYGTRSFTSAYKTDSTNLASSLTFSSNQTTRITTRAFVKSDNITEVTGTAGVIVAEAANPRRTTVGLGYTFSYDNRRDDFEREFDYFLRLNQDISAGNNVAFAKTTFETGVRKYFWDNTVKISAELDAGALTYLNGASRITDRFLSSPRQLRGFKFGSVGPKQGTTPLGGDYYAVVRLESEFPLGFSEEYGITGGFFTDTGTVWGLDTSTTSGQSDVTSAEFKLRTVVGATLFWKTPIGPLRFNFTRALVKEELDDTENFNLTLSTDF